MKTVIEITGQINGNSKLAGAIQTHDSETKRTMFNGYAIVFKTKASAKKALWEAYKYLRIDKEDAEASRLSYSKFGSLRYDASQASIINA